MAEPVARAASWTVAEVVLHLAQTEEPAAMRQGDPERRLLWLASDESRLAATGPHAETALHVLRSYAVTTVEPS